jgi:hypothetical protein
MIVVLVHHCLILYNIGSTFKLGSKESQETADRLREGLKRFESNTGKDSCGDLVRGYCKTHRLFFSQFGLLTSIAEATEVVHVVTIFCRLALA